MNNVPDMNKDFFETFAGHVARHKGKTQVIKIGGEVVAKEEMVRHHMVQAINLMNFGANVIYVHGGGTQITAELKKAGIDDPLIEGIRRSSPEGVIITERCVRELNNDITRIFSEEASRMNADVQAIGLGGFWNNVIKAEPMFEGTRTGTVTKVNADMLRALSGKSFMPIIYPICAGPSGEFMNVNADDVAANVAEAIGADRLHGCTDVDGVKDKSGQVIPQLYTDQIPALIADGTIYGGMIPKVENAARLAENKKVGGVVILNGKDPNAIVAELFTDRGTGTLIQLRP